MNFVFKCLQDIIDALSMYFILYCLQHVFVLQCSFYWLVFFLGGGGGGGGVSHSCLYFDT